MVFFIDNGKSAFAQSPGFFLEDHAPKTATIPGFDEFAKPDGGAAVTVNSNFNAMITPVGKYLFGNNANPYMTQMVTEPVLLDYIRDLKPNVIRYPGGNISSVFFWNAKKNAPPSDAPLKILNGASFSLS